MISDITIILLLYKTPLKLIKNFEVFKKFKVVVLDQSNDKNFKKKLTKILPNIKNYSITNQNNGYAKGINTLVKKVQTKYFFLVEVIFPGASLVHTWSKVTLELYTHSVALVEFIPLACFLIRDLL